MDWVEVRFTEELAAALKGLGLTWTWLMKENGGAVLRVQMDAEVDGYLERVIGGLAAIRWGYQPGRDLQLALPWVEKKD